MDSRAVKLIEKRIQQHRKWLERGAWFRTQQFTFIQQAMQDETLTSLGLLADSVRSLGLFYGARGVVSVYDGNDGWTDVTAAIECYYWSTRLEIKSYYSWYAPLRVERRAFLLGGLPRAVGMLCNAVSVVDKERERELWSLLQTPLLDDDPAVDGWWYQRRFEPFMVNLYAKTRGLDVPLDLLRCDLGVYGPILTRWQDDQAVAAALREACDYHCKVMFGTDEDWDSEFDRPPLDLIPVEVYAVNRLRADGGLRAVEVDHPLMHAIGPIVQASTPPELVETLSRVQLKHDEF